MLYQFFKVDYKETKLSRRGFDYDSDFAKTHLEQIGTSFLDGYHALLKDNSLKNLENLEQNKSISYKGFAMEGAGMGLAVADFFKWKNKKFPKIVQSSLGQKYIYLLYVGLGWALARLPFKNKMEQRMKQLDPLLKWLVIDGYGFHEAYFNTQQTLYEQKIPSHLSEYATSIFHQGIGRCIWFAKGMNVEAIAALIKTFPSNQQGNLWSGIGLASAYAGIVEKETYVQLKKKSGNYWLHLAQGAAFAAQARIKPNTLIASTEIACDIYAGMSATTAAKITDKAIEVLRQQKKEGDYQLWRVITQNQIMDYQKAAFSKTVSASNHTSKK